MKSIYKGVYFGKIIDRRGKVTRSGFQAKHHKNGVSWTSIFFETERQAAIAYDKRLIELGLDPVNVLKHTNK